MWGVETPDLPLFPSRSLNTCYSPHPYMNMNKCDWNETKFLTVVQELTWAETVLMSLNELNVSDMTYITIFKAL